MYDCDSMLSVKWKSELYVAASGIKGEWFIVRWMIYIVLGYAALFAGVWLHEIGHSLLDFKFGCKDNWIHVQVKPYIFFSTPGPVDIDKYLALTPLKRTLAAYGGIIANLFWSIISGGLIVAVKPENIYLMFFLWMFMTLNLSEIVSYLLIGNIYLVSDMAVVANEYPKLRIPNFILGLVLTVVYILILVKVPSIFQWLVIVWNIITIASMCGGRIVFSILHR